VPSVCQAIQSMNQTRCGGHMGHWVLVKDSRKHGGTAAGNAREEVECFVHVFRFALLQKKKRILCLLLPKRTTLQLV
jgi:hypothetical protein